MCGKCTGAAPCAGAGWKTSSTATVLTDHQTEPAVVYYRIKSVDRDGRFKYSNIVRLAGDSSSILPKAFPQLVHHPLTLQHPVIRGNAVIGISTSDGRVVATVKPIHNSLQTSIDMSKLQPGLYVVRFTNEKGSDEAVKGVKQ